MNPAYLSIAVSGAILAQLLSASPAISEDAFCTAIRKVAAQSANGFKPFMGRQTGADTWSANFSLPGSTRCKIGGDAPGLVGADFAYNCSFATRSAAEAENVSQALQDSLSKCYPGVNRSEAPAFRGFPPFVEFGYLPDTFVIVMLYAQPNHSVEIWLVDD